VVSDEGTNDTVPGDLLQRGSGSSLQQASQIIPGDVGVTITSGGEMADHALFVGTESGTDNVAVSIRKLRENLSELA